MMDMKQAIENIKTDIRKYYDTTAELTKKEFVERLDELFANPDWCRASSKIIARATDYSQLDDLLKNPEVENHFELVSQNTFDYINDHLTDWMKNNMDCKSADRVITNFFAKSAVASLLLEAY